MIVRMVWPNDQSYIIEDSDPFSSHFNWAIILLLCSALLVALTIRSRHRLVRITEDQIVRSKTKQKGTMAPRPTEEEDMGYGDMDYGAFTSINYCVIQVCG